MAVDDSKDGLRLLARLLSEQGFRVRAIALCGRWTGLTEKQVQAVIIIEGGAEFAAADTVPWGAVMTRHVQGHPTDEGQILSRAVVARPTGVLAKLHIQDPALLIFDAPVTANGGREPIPVSKRA